MVAVRIARKGDSLDIARVHVDTWRTTYQGLVDDGFLERLSYDRSQRWWDGVLSDQSPRSCAFVLENDEEVVGFAYAGETRTPHLPFDSELYAIYVLQQYQRKGGGRLLVDAVRDALRDAGFRSMLVWVLDTNPNRTFYERLGGALAGSKEDRIGDVAVTEVGYGWNSI